MKKSKTLSILSAILFGFIIIIAPVKAADGYNNWEISSFDSLIQIEKNGSVMVTETIVADFSKEQHHGILRDIPVRYEDDLGNKLKLDLEIIKITDEKGVYEWPYKQYDDGDYLELKIGDPDLYLSEPATFKITYKLEDAVTFFKDHDELYWNVTGTEWPVAINSTSATIQFPPKDPAGGIKVANAAGPVSTVETEMPEIKKEDLQTICYTGYYGSTAQDCSIEIINNVITFKANQRLESSEGLTAVVGFPKGVVIEPAMVEKVLRFSKNNWAYLIPIILTIYLFIIWYTRGRDPEADRTTIMPHYNPPDKLTPSEVGTMIDENVDIRDITAAIIDLAIRGYIKIIEKDEKGEEYEFQKLKDFEKDSGLKEHEKKILQAMFDSVLGASKDTVKLSDLKNKFYRSIPGIKNQIYEELVEKGYFQKNPEKVRDNYYAIGWSLIGIVFFLLIFIGIFIGFKISIITVISGIIFLIFAPFMPAKTKKGVEVFYKIKGLEEYINTAEKDRIKFQEKENIFEKLLPYAMALNIAEKWSKAFEGINKTAPDWYQSSSPSFAHNFTTFYFLHSLNKINNSMQSTLQSAPRSSSSGSSWGGHSGFGGGFSGGGFGGGGGGSW